MGFRNISRALLVMLAVSAVCSAQAISETRIETVMNNTIMGIIEGSDSTSPVIYLLFALNIAILIIYSMYGYITQNDKELMNARGEFGQLLVSLAVIALTYVFFITVNQLFLSQFNEIKGGAPVTSIKEYNSNVFDAFRLDAEGTMTSAYNSIVDYRADAAVPTTVPMLYTSPGTAAYCLAMPSVYLTLWIYGPGEYTNAVIKCSLGMGTINIKQDAYKNAYADVLDMEVSSIMSGFFNLMVFMILLGKFFIDDALVYMFFGGIILRMSPWTRKAGDLIILVSLVAYIFYPFLYAVFLAAAQSVDTHGADIVTQICSGLGPDANLPPFNDCSGATGIMKLGKYAVLSSFVSSVILGLSLSILNNFRKVFEMVE